MDQLKNMDFSLQKLPITLRASLRSMWFLLFGIVLGPAIIILERDPYGHPAKWILLSALCAAVIIYRLGLKYVINSDNIICRHWYGLGREDKITISQIRVVKVSQGFSGRLVNCGHVEISSAAKDETVISILGQGQPNELADFIEALAYRQRSHMDEQNVDN